MDYKQVAGVIKWHAMHSDLNGAEARLLMFMVASCNHKTSRIQASHAELAEAVGLSKAAVTKAVKSLEGKKAISIDVPASGRMVATYRVRSADDLDGYFATEQNNPAAEEWYARHQNFAELEFAHDSIGDGCEECSEDALCAMHQFKVKQMEDSTEWREYQLWLADNPKPPAKVMAVKGRVGGVRAG